MKHDDSMVKRTGPGGLHLEELGSGAPVIFVHGASGGGARTFQAQLPLSQRWRLIFPYRLGHAPSPPTPGDDFEAWKRFVGDDGLFGILDRQETRTAQVRSDDLVDEEERPPVFIQRFHD